MRSSYDAEDKKELEELQADSWMIELLSLNPGYCHWGPHEDYMCSRRDGWDSAVTSESWGDFKLTLDELNECVNFYFSVDRESKECTDCRGSGYNPETKKIADDFYDLRGGFMGSSGSGSNRWCDNITVDEAQALCDAGRLHDLTHTFVKGEGWVPKDPPPVVDEEFTRKVNEWNKTGIGHDGINRWILVETRAKRLGVWGECPYCEGKGYIFTAPKAEVTLVLWILHPRKGASRGWEVKNIQKDDIPAILSFLREAAERNFDRFKKAIEFNDALAQ